MIRTVVQGSVCICVFGLDAQVLVKGDNAEGVFRVDWARGVRVSIALGGALVLNGRGSRATSIAGMFHLLRRGMCEKRGQRIQGESITNMSR